MHDEEVRIVDVELDRLKHVLNGLLSGLVSVDEVLGHATHCDLTSDRNLRIRLEAHRRAGLIGVVEDDGDRCSRNTSLPSFVDEILEIRSSDLMALGGHVQHAFSWWCHADVTQASMTYSRHIRDAQDEADCVEDVTLSTTVEPCDCVEALIEARDVGAHGIAEGGKEGDGVRDSVGQDNTTQHAFCLL